MTSLLSNGMACITNAVLNQLCAKHPIRTAQVDWPHTSEKPSPVQSTTNDTKHADSTQEKKQTTINPCFTNTLKMDTVGPQREKMDIDNDTNFSQEEKASMLPSTPGEQPNQSKVPGTGFPSISVNKEDILRAIGDAKRYTSGGLQQINP